MNTITHPELKLAFSFGGVKRVTADNENGKYKLNIKTDNGTYTLVTQKGGVRLFSKIDTAWNVLQEVGISEMIVNV